MSCNTSWMYRSNCSGGARECNGCGDSYCGYHFVAVQPVRASGGHVCPGACATSAVYVQNCEGANYKCPGCDYRYCEYHLLPVAHIGVLQGGHVCTNTAGSGIVDAVLNRVSIPGVGSINDVNEYIRAISRLA